MPSKPPPRSFPVSSVEQCLYSLCSIVRPLDDWVSGISARTSSLPLSALKGAVVGIDATHYISQHLSHPSTREPLLIALGGFPFALRSNIEKELQIFKDLGVACIFVFNGLDFGKKNQRPQVQHETVRAFEHAWELYDQQQADQVVDAFSSVGMVSGFLPVGTC